jgi:mono/diheme cytochrome c family protein
MRRLGALIWVLFAAACGTGRRSEPISGPPLLDQAAEQRGELVFMHECNQCHPGGDAGLGPAINNKPLPEAVLRLQVRKGLGAMPALDDHVVSEGELDDLVEYLQALRAA